MKLDGGHHRGLLYFGIAVLTPMAAQFGIWAAHGQTFQSIPTFELLAVFVESIVAGLVAVRAYIDQHLSNTKLLNQPKTPPTP
jgi:hypothetical protein